MRERVDAEGGVIEQHRAPEEADHQAGPAGDQKTDDRQRDRRQELEPVQPHELAIAREIRDLHQVGAVVPAGKNPSHMAVREAPVAGRMHVRSLSECR